MQKSASIPFFFNLKTEKVITQAFADSEYEVYIASKYLQPKDACTIANQIIHSSQMRQNALALGKKLTEGGGVGVIVENIL